MRFVNRATRQACASTQEAAWRMIAAKSRIRGLIDQRNWRSYGETNMDCVRLIFRVRGGYVRAGRQNCFAGSPEGDGRRELDTVFRDGPFECLRPSLYDSGGVAGHEPYELHQND